MTDFHSHILPKMDDGSRSEEESLAMLNALSEQGVSRVMATPHFYANDESVADFINRRQNSLESLMSLKPSEMPEILAGAEVRYYEGISRLSELKSLCIDGTRLLLLEMQERKWTEYTLRELADISSGGKVTLVLAHVERYIGFQRPDTFYRLLENGILMQMNASFVNGFFTKRKAIRMLRNNEVHFLGSDCHNMDTRPPDIGSAFKTIQNKLGCDFAEGFKNYTNEFLK